MNIQMVDAFAICAYKLACLVSIVMNSHSSSSASERRLCGQIPRQAVIS